MSPTAAAQEKTTVQAGRILITMRRGSRVSQRWGWIA